jgi:hypothetical protein
MEKSQHVMLFKPFLCPFMFIIAFSFTDAVKKSNFNKVIPPFGMVDKGHILSQHHGGLVSFKNIKIRVL